MFLIFWFPSSESDSDDEEVSLSSMIKQSLMMRKRLLQHDYDITSWALSILPEIQDDVRLNLDGNKRMSMKRVIAKLHVASNPNSKVANGKINVIIDNFWKEFGHFQNKTGVYGLHPRRFLLPDALNGNSYL